LRTVSLAPLLAAAAAGEDAGAAAGVAESFFSLAREAAGLVAGEADLLLPLTGFPVLRGDASGI
jgi:hypothetical protein